MEATVRIENRSQLIYLLTEAAELEHGIMCCYLFAAFTLKTQTAEGVSDEQLRSIRRWRRLISQIAVEEMLHLASVCNILTAVGGSPQLRRPNLPTSPRAYGASFELRLAPFNLGTLEQFITVEKPRETGESLDEAARYELPNQASRRLTDIFSSERDYDSQGKLYTGIEDGLMYLAQKYGEGGLFIGRPEAQTGDRYFPTLPGLMPVTDLSSAATALKIIVEQGEGATRESTDSHYSKFMSIWEEYGQLLAQDPEFQPARPVLANPYALLPTDVADTSGINLIEDDNTDNVCNLFDGCYELLVQMLGRLFLHGGESQEELQRLAKVTERMMLEVIGPLGTLLTTLPAGPSHPGMRAGPSFRLSRAANPASQGETAWAIFRERMSELAAYCRFLQAGDASPAALGRVSDALGKYVEALQPQG